jgi:hypothetical protein
MGVVLDTLRELERQDFAGAGKALLVSPRKALDWSANMRHVTEFPPGTVERLGW